MLVIPLAFEGKPSVCVNNGACPMQGARFAGSELARRSSVVDLKKAYLSA